MIKLPIKKKIDWKKVEKKTVKFLKGFDRNFYELFLEHLSVGNKEIHKALDVITKIDQELRMGYKHGFFIHYIQNPNEFEKVWGDLVSNNNLAENASARIHMINDMVKEMGHNKFMKLIRGHDIVEIGKFKILAEKVKETELEYIDHLALILEEIRKDFLTYNKYVIVVLDVYAKGCGSDEMKGTAALTRQKYDNNFNKGINELNKAAKLLRRGKKHVFRKLNKTEKKLSE